MSEANNPTEQTASETPSEMMRRHTHSRLKSVLSGVFGVLAIIGLFASTLAVWGHGVLFNEDKVASAVDAALQQPEVTTAMATYLADQIFVVADVQGRVAAALPEKLVPLAPSIVGGAHSFAEGRLESLLATDTTRNLINGLVRTAHGAVIGLLEGAGLVDAIHVENGEVSINFLPLISSGLTTVQNLGLFDDVAIPDLSTIRGPNDQIAALEKAFGKDLPDRFGQLVVFRSDALASGQTSLSIAQRMVVLVKRAIWLIIAATAVLMACSIVLSDRRRRAVVVMALGGAAAMLLARVVVKQVIADAPSLVSNPGGRAALAATIGSLGNGLIRLTTALLIVAIATAITAFISGTSSRAEAIRSRTGIGGRSLRDAVRSHTDATAGVLLFAGVFVIVVFGITLVTLTIAVLLAISGALALSRRANTNDNANSNDDSASTS